MVTLKLQVKGVTISRFRCALGALSVTIQEEHAVRDATFNGFSIDVKYIVPHARVVEYFDFEAGVRKIQNSKSFNLTDTERRAVRGLIRIRNENEQTTVNKYFESMSKRLAKRRKVTGNETRLF